MMNRWSALALLLAIVGGALALRVPNLGNRPLHNDEAVNAVKVSELWQHGRYAYDPDEYHGPTLHYATVPFLALSGARNSDGLSDGILRLAPVAFGVGLILLLLLFTDGLGRPAILWAALFIAISPAMVFYSRYFIHEMLLVFFTALMLGAAWRYTQTRTAHWALLSGAGLGLMFATKETFVITLGAMGLAGMITAWWTTRRGSRLQTWRSWWNWKHAALFIGTALVIWLVLFTSFFTNWSGPLDSLRTYLPWLKRAGGHSPHIHPWSFYLERLAWFHPAKGPVWSEALILGLAAVGALVSLGGKKSALHRFLALYTIILTAVYSMISYKTPWCLLSFFHGMILLAGIGAAALVEPFRGRVMKTAIAAVLLAFTAQLTWQAWRASFVFAADRRNPYVYAQTVPDLLNLVARVDAIARVPSTGYETVVKVIAPESDYWPLPWYLRRFKHVGWYERMPDDPFAPIVIVASELDARLDDKSDRKWIMAGLTELRPGKFFEFYVELELWKKFVETLPRERE
ncbi:MAG TPA: flippase activity-associated protein Agl23 [Candidatus Acidoferrum sp.]|nr:flippase activity-associated protein Agl23 [Candidatus Acidoferrum sp.]